MSPTVTSPLHATCRTTCRCGQMPRCAPQVADALFWVRYHCLLPPSTMPIQDATPPCMRPCCPYKQPILDDLPPAALMPSANCPARLHHHPFLIIITNLILNSRALMRIPLTTGLPARGLPYCPTSWSSAASARLRPRMCYFGDCYLHRAPHLPICGLAAAYFRHKL